MENSPDVAETVIRIEGLEKPLKVLHVSDFHICLCDDRNGEMLEHMAQRNQRFGNDSDERLLSLIDYAESNGTDFIAMTGDMLEMSTEANLDFFRGLNTRIKTPWSFCMGNHEWHYTDGVSVREHWCRRYQFMTDHNLNSHWIDRNGLRMVFLDDSNYQIDEVQLAFVKKALTRPCVFFMHIPLYIESLREDCIKKWNAPTMLAADDWGSESRKELEASENSASSIEFRKLIETDANAKAIFAGHLHILSSNEYQDDRFQYTVTDGGARYICFEIL